MGLRYVMLFISVLGSTVTARGSYANFNASGVTLVGNGPEAGPGSGNVMVNGAPVCDDGWDMSDGAVVCRQLGFFGIERVTSSSYFGSVSSNFAMDDVQCDGSEARLQDCRYNANDNCGGGEGAGVICSTYVGENGTCSDRQFQCADGFCVYLDSKCNGHYECGDRSDEEGCPRPEASTVFQLLLEALVSNSYWRQYIPDNTDTDGDGIISERELQSKFHSYMETVFKMIDQDGDESVSQEELRTPRITQDNIKRGWELAAESYPIKLYYQILDANGNGFIDRADFRLHMCGRSGPGGRRGPRGPCRHRRDEEVWNIVEKYIQIADQNNDKRISFEELRDKASSYLGPIFKILDQNDDGVISLDDLQATTFKLGRNEILDVFGRAFDALDMESKNAIDMMYDLPFVGDLNLDDNFDGKLNLRDIYGAFRRERYIGFELYILAQVSRNLDKNQNGIIHRQEMTEFLDTLFNVTDSNNDGFLSAEDVYTIMQELPMRIDTVHAIKAYFGQLILYFRGEYSNIADKFLVNVDEDENNEMSLEELIGVREDLLTSRSEKYRYRPIRFPEPPRSLRDIYIHPLDILAGILDDPSFHT
jgi:Ca2+-binding EF-hand superfamily protein